MFSALRTPWWLAGGYAIELAVGRAFREHDDIDVLLLRRDQLTAQRVLAGWEWWAADPPGVLRPWQPGETLPAHVHDIWCRPTAAQPWRIQFMLDESSGEDWISRRDPRVRRPISTLGHTSPDGIPYLAPEIQLFYKARGLRAKDDADFDAIHTLLDAQQRQWLVDAIRDTYGAHPWLDRLMSIPPQPS
ncbi:MAG TPA: amino acid transporter [Pseudonocardiaceae bacterium]|nr:amino acid transporter [Pseudonocardiaceae bacterium]